MIGGYLAFARGEGTEQAEPVNLSAVLEEVAAGARRAGAAVEVDVPPALTLPLRADAVRRAITNLVDNARRHAHRVALAAMPQGRMVFVTVDDDGPGIPPDRRESVFRPFESDCGRRHRARPDDRPRHRPRAWRRDRAGGQPAGRAAGAHQAAGLVIARRVASRVVRQRSRTRAEARVQEPQGLTTGHVGLFRLLRQRFHFVHRLGEARVQQRDGFGVGLLDQIAELLHVRHSVLVGVLQQFRLPDGLHLRRVGRRQVPSSPRSVRPCCLASSPCGGGPPPAHLPEQPGWRPSGSRGFSGSRTGTPPCPAGREASCRRRTS